MRGAGYMFVPRTARPALRPALLRTGMTQQGRPTPADVHSGGLSGVTVRPPATPCFCRVTVPRRRGACLYSATCSVTPSTPARSKACCSASRPRRDASPSATSASAACSGATRAERHRQAFPRALPGGAGRRRVLARALAAPLARRARRAAAVVPVAVPAAAHGGAPTDSCTSTDRKARNGALDRRTSTISPVSRDAGWITPDTHARAAAGARSHQGRRSS